MIAQATRMECHKLCEIFPQMPEEEFAALKADIEANGLRQPIWTHRGKILEGRARYRACRELGIEPDWQEWEGEDGPDLVGFIVSLNLQRRHLNPSQKALIATIAEEKFAEQAKRRAKERARERAEARKRGEEIKENQLVRRDYKDSSAWKAGELVGVSGTSVTRAKLVKREAPDLAEKVKDGQVTLAQATREVARIEKRRDLDAKAALHAERESNSWKILEGDCVELLPDLISPTDSYQEHKADPCFMGTVRLVFADPPYNIGVRYGEHYDDARPFDEYQEWCREWMEEIGRVLTWDGSFFLLIGLEWAPFLCADALEMGFHYRQWITWFESFGVNCSRKYNRCSRALIWFTRHRETFVWNPDAVNRPSDRQTIYGDKRADPGGKVWDDVWGINPPIPRLVDNSVERLPDFPTQLPLALLRPIIGAHSDPGDLVLDPFSGSGTTGCACIELGRQFVGVELSPVFAELSRKRLLVHSKEVIRVAQA